MVYDITSQVARKFHTNSIQRELKTCPGVNSQNIRLFTRNGITTADHLIGRFFLVNRDEVEFIVFLQSLGVKEKDAVEISCNLFIKFGNL